MHMLPYKLVVCSKTPKKALDFSLLNEADPTPGPPHGQILDTPLVATNYTFILLHLL